MAVDTHSFDESNGASLVITAIIFLVLTWISVTLRTYVRAFMTNGIQVDDWLMLVSQANFTLSCAFILVGVRDGLGHHNDVLPQMQEISALKWQALATATYIANMMFIKLSLGLFLLRLATQRRYQWIIWISMGVVLIWSSALFLWDVFQCNPVMAQWDYTVPGHKCVSPQEVVNAAYSLSVQNILTDWLYALLPIPMIWNAKMTMQAKITVALVLGLGIFASIATLIRVKFLADLTDTDDLLYAGTDAMVWTLVEPGVAIVASSLVTIRPLLRRLRLRGFESSEHSRGKGRWARHGGAVGGKGGVVHGVEGPLSQQQNNKHQGVIGSHNSRVTISNRGMAGMDADDVGLSDLESGRNSVASRGTGKSKGKTGGRKGKTGGGGIVWSRDTTLTSRTSAAGDGRDPHASWGRVWSDAVQEDKEISEDEEQAHQNRGDQVGIAVSPVSPWLASREGEGLFKAAGPLRNNPVRGHIQGGRTVWSTGPATYAPDDGAISGVETRNETPHSPEESEGIQGLRHPASRSGGRANSPFP